MPPEPLGAYVAWAKRAALNHLSRHECVPHLVLVMGNEAGDLDSVASALVLSYVLAHAPALAAAYRLPPHAVYAPLIQVERAALAYRRENLLVYDALGLDCATLLCVDDLGVDRKAPAAFAPEAHVSLGLVDHACLVPAWGAPDARRAVVLVVDHHEEEAAHTDAGLRLVRAPRTDPVGSCASLVAHVYGEALRASHRAPDRTAADLLLSAVALDTKKMRRAPQGKATDVDVQACAYLLPHASFASFASPTTRAPFVQAAGTYGVALAPPADAPPEAALAAWADALRAVKRDVAHLDTHALLARDLKVAHLATRSRALLVGWASVPLALAALVARGPRGMPGSAADGAAPAKPTADKWRAWWAAVQAFRAARGLDVLVVLLAHKAPTRPRARRELVLLRADGAPPLGALVARLVQYATPSLELTPYGPSEEEVCAPPAHAAVFAQGNCAANRKVVVPVFTRLLEGM